MHQELKQKYKQSKYGSSPEIVQWSHFDFRLLLCFSLLQVPISQSGHSFCWTIFHVNHLLTVADSHLSKGVFVIRNQLHLQNSYLLNYLHGKDEGEKVYFPIFFSKSLPFKHKVTGRKDIVNTASKNLKKE